VFFGGEFQTTRLLTHKLLSNFIKIFIPPNFVCCSFVQHTDGKLDCI